jgi:hypothetical protein
LSRSLSRHGGPIGPTVEPFLQEDLGSSTAVLSHVQIVGGRFQGEGEWDDLGLNRYLNGRVGLNGANSQLEGPEFC